MKKLNVYKSLALNTTMNSSPFDLRIKPRRGTKKLSKYGDYDLDGTLNYKDCNPYDPSQDGLFGRLLNIVSFGKKGQSKEAYKAERALKKVQKTKEISSYKQLSKVVSKVQRPTIKQRVSGAFQKYQQQKAAKAKAFAESRKVRVVEKPTGRYIWDKDKGLVEEKQRVVIRPAPTKRMIAERRIKGRIRSIPSRIKSYNYKNLPMPFQGIGDKSKEKFDESRGQAGNVRYGVYGVVIKSPKRTTESERKTLKGRVTGKVGRPKGTFSRAHIDPRTGQPIPATEWYKLQRALKRRAKAIAEARDVLEAQALAKKGIPPEQARVIIDQRQLRQLQQRVAQQIPVRVPQRVQVIPQRVQVVPRYPQNQQQTPQIQQIQRPEVSLLTGKPIYEYGVVPGTIPSSARGYKNNAQRAMVIRR